MNEFKKNNTHKLIILTIVFQFFCCLILHAAINPVYKECLQRGYTLAKGDYCLFPDSTKCLITDFNEGRCGQKWFTEDYCVKEGQYIWDADKCCPGLVAYLPKGIAGQARCRSKGAVFIDRYNLNRPLLWIGVIVIGILFWFRRKRSQTPH